MIQRAIDGTVGLRRGGSADRAGPVRRPIETGSQALDALLGGGVPAGRIVDFSGASGVGKTQLCMQLCVQVQRLRSGGRESLCAVYVDTAGTFRPERLREIATHRRIRGEATLRKVYVNSARGLDEQMRLPQTIKDLASRAPIGLVVIDTLSENFIYQPGDEVPLLRRQSLLAKHLNDLAHLALDVNIGVVVTNTVRTAIDEDRKPHVEVGGTATTYGPHLRVRIERSNSKRVATLLRPPSFGKACFEIRVEGLVDCGS